MFISSALEPHLGAGGGLPAQRFRNVHVTIQGAPSDAERKGTVVRNTADLAEAPQPAATATA